MRNQPGNRDPCLGRMNVSFRGRDQTSAWFGEQRWHHGVMWSPPRVGTEPWPPAAALAGLGVCQEPLVSLAVPQGPALRWLQTARGTQSR